MKHPKLAREQALEIRRAYTATDCTGAGMLVLAQRYGVSTTTIYNILAGKHVLTAGMPKVSGQRKSLRGHVGWGEAHRRPTQWQVKDAGLKPTGTRLPRADRKRVACPRCGAKPGEACTNPRVGSYAQPLQKLHAERRPEAVTS